MATNVNANPTLVDLANITDPSGNVMPVVEILNQTNEVLPDMTWIEGNQPTGNLTTIRTGIPSPVYRRMYQGVQPTKSTTAQVMDTCGMLEDYAEVDKAAVDIANNAAAFRMQESAAHVEGFAQKVAKDIFFANERTNPDAFTGLGPRFSTTAAKNGENIIRMKDVNANDYRSMWLVCWGPKSVHGIVPKGSKAGIQVRDLGEVTIENANQQSDGSGGRMQAYRMHFRWDVGLTVKNWQYIVRIANIPNFKDMTPDDTKELSDLMFQAVDLVPNMVGVRPAFYMDRGTRTALRQGLYRAVGNSTLEIENVGGVMTYTWMGIPLRKVDALAVDESQVATS